MAWRGWNGRVAVFTWRDHFALLSRNPCSIFSDGFTSTNSSKGSDGQLLFSFDQATENASPVEHPLQQSFPVQQQAPFAWQTPGYGYSSQFVLRGLSYDIDSLPVCKAHSLPQGQTHREHGSTYRQRNSHFTVLRLQWYFCSRRLRAQRSFS